MFRPSHRSFCLGAALAFATTAACGEVDSAVPSTVAEAGYRNTITARAEKIVAPLGIADAAKATRVAAVVARQYFDLHDIQSARDTKLKLAKSQAGEKAAVESATQAARAEADASVAKLHAAFLARLAAELSPAQIDQVKDGMTYGVLPLTNRVYQEMLPALTLEQKAQILAWLTEAREHAMDGFTSDEKHAWFGKYKGRINNFLAKAGYNMKDAEKEMLARQKTERTAK